VEVDEEEELVEAEGVAVAETEHQSMFYLLFRNDKYTHTFLSTAHFRFLSQFTDVAQAT